MNNKSSTVSTVIGLRLTASRDTVVPLSASLFFRGEDPYAIRIMFHAGLDEPVTWVFARDLLAVGISGAAGLGDVQIWPSAVEPGIPHPGRMNIELSSPSGRAHFEASAAELGEFLRRTYQIVPNGRESEHLDIDTELNDLLRQS
jgi:hypothetical protein